MTVNEGLIRDILRLVVWFPLRWIIVALPVRASFYVFRLMGMLHNMAGGAKKESIRKSLGILLGLSEARATRAVGLNLENHYIDRLHIFLYPKLRSKESIEGYIRFENIEVLDEALKKGRGALIVQPHFGPVQLTLLALALYGYNPIQIGYQSDKGLSNIGRSVSFKYRLKYESMLPVPIVAADKFLGRVYKHLLKNGVVLTTGDGAGGGVYLGEQTELDFLNTKRLFPLGPATLSLKTGAAYIPTFIVREGPGRFKIRFEGPIEPGGEDAEKDKHIITEKFRDITQNYIEQYPFAWHFWGEVLKKAPEVDGTKRSEK